MRINCFFVALLCLMISGCSNKELDTKYGTSFNRVREKNGVPLLSKKWNIATKFNRDEISWVPHNNKEIYDLKKVIIRSDFIVDSNRFCSGRKVKSGDPDCGLGDEYISMHYYFDKTGTKVKKLEIYTNSPDASNYKIELNEAKSLLKKWGVDFDKLLTSE